MCGIPKISWLPEYRKTILNGMPFAYYAFRFIRTTTVTTTTKMMSRQQNIQDKPLIRTSITFHTKILIWQILNRWVVVCECFSESFCRRSETVMARLVNAVKTWTTNSSSAYSQSVHKRYILCIQYLCFAISHVFFGLRCPVILILFVFFPRDNY